MSANQQNSNGTNYSTAHIGGGDPHNYEDWGNTDFNLLEFIGTEESPLDSNSESFDADDDMHKKDVAYQNFQYNALAFDPPMDNGYAEAPSVYDHQSGAVYVERPLYNQQMDGSQMPSTSRHSGSNLAVKVEPVVAVGDYYETESERGQSMELDSQAGGPMRNYHPRKYRVKSDTEKKNPVYKVKRERNNDAVRRSRDKAKKAQEDKDERLFYLEQENPKLLMQNKRLSERMAILEKSLLQVKQQCRCPARRLIP